ncbi:MAG TPA: PilZ domain-containing protein [Acidimicrobiia bacterium]|nr:PilZ domain-containing protein [Acidimicrobiia bacterium]
MEQLVRPGRQHERFRLGGIVRLIVDHPGGLVTAIGHLVDLSEGGCQLRFHTRVDANLAARVRIEVAGNALWIPVLTRWVRRDVNEWTVGCAFDRPTLEKQVAIRDMLHSRPRLSA